MRRGRFVVLGGLALLAGLALVAPSATDANEQHGTYTKNKRWGFEIRAPKKWASRVVPLDERWIAGKWFPDYSLKTRNELKEIVSIKPDLWVIGFPHEREKNRRTETKLDEHTTLITIRNPYKDYKDFVKRESWASTGGGGWYYAKEESIEHDGYKVDVYEIKVEKLVRAPMRVVTWVYHCDDVDFAIQLRILEEHYAPNKRVIDGVMKSFRQIARTEPFPKDEEPNIKVRLGTDKPERTKTLEEITAERNRKVEQRIARELEHLPKDWRARTTKHFVILGPKDKRYTMPMTYVGNFAEDLRKYLEKHFKDLGPQEVPRGLIRIFKSTADEQAYRQGTRGWWTDEVGEITMTYSAERSLLSEFSWVANRLTDQYFHIKNENLRWGMPGWIRTGIWGHIAWARPSKRKKMVLAPVPHDIIEIRRLLAADGELKLKDLMTVSGDEVDSAHHAQARSVVYWLLGRGNKGKVKGSMMRYLQSLEDIIKEEDEKFEKAENERMQQEREARAAEAEAERQKTDEELEREEDERFRQRRENRNSFNEGLKSKYEAIRLRAQEAAFGHLTEKDWESLHKKWKKFAGK